MTEPFCIGSGRRLHGSSRSGPGKEGSKKEVRLALLQDPPKLVPVSSLRVPRAAGMPVARGGQTVPGQASLCFDPGSPACDRTEGKKKGRPKAENQALRDIPLSLMNQWKDEFKAHSRVKCPNSGCWLEFPSIYGLKYHYQRCRGVSACGSGNTAGRRPQGPCPTPARPAQGAISDRLAFPCPFCEAAFTSKTQLEKHRIWNHMDRPLPAPKPGPVSRPVGVSPPVTGSKPVGISKPVTVSRPVPVSKPITVSRPVPVSRPMPVSRPVPVTKLVPVSKHVPLTKPVPVSRPIVVTKPVPVSRPIAISRHTPSCKMVLLTKSENRAPRAVGRSSGKKRAAEDLDACPIPPKQVRPENGECGPSTTGQCTTFQLVAEPRESPLRPGSRPLMDEEDSERTKHRRKQKTPRKFTGEQPSISGTFGLKGLAKAEDKTRGHRSKKQEYTSPEDGRKKTAAPPAAISKEVPAAVAHSAPGGSEEQWQRAIHERGAVVCPTCGVVTRKTLAGLKRHMEVCQQLQDALKCQHCRKQFKSKAGLNYHTMAEHSAKPCDADTSPGGEQEERERLRKVLKQMGRLRCSREGCGAAFSSLMGYQYHQRRCGKPPCEVDSPSFPCAHCGKTYRSKAGHDYHVRSEHTAPPSEEPTEKTLEAEDLLGVERTPSGRIRRTSAQVAVFHLQEIAEDELARDWTKRRMKEDLVPETARLNYTRPGLPTLNPQLLEAWKSQVKEKGHVNCPNDCCEAIYSSVSGLKAHLASCGKGDHLVGKYHCLLCPKEFGSESGVKYHILKTHAENWFRTSADTPPRHRSRDPEVPEREKRRSVSGGKRRGRKPKAPPPQECAPKAQALCSEEDWLPGGRDRGPRGSAGRKVAGKTPEK
ncbi:zinc finger protein 512B isoform X3 [Ochotona princeps]|uniref:zinc finger protein 512B isoform X3 n=1 Tax=Ochotona princeps TaxID=9978 RepID=UPI002715591B|nr:zinc finger protein 512B isoform X3 [Ochotona princeps]